MNKQYNPSATSRFYGARLKFWAWLTVAILIFVWLS